MGTLGVIRCPPQPVLMFHGRLVYVVVQRLGEKWYVVLNRKKYLFMGPESGEKSDVIACSLIETAKLNGLDPKYR